MSKSQDEILARELGKLGNIFGPGESRGVDFASRFLSTETFIESLRIEAEAEKVLQSVFRILTSMGQITDEFAESSGSPRLSAIVGSGFLQLNPAVVHVQVVPAGEHSSDVSIIAVAKEGLIKQHTAEKAVKKFSGELSKVYS